MYPLIRQQLVSTIDTAYSGVFPDVPIVYDNAPFDWNNPPPRFVAVEIRFNAGLQINLAELPTTRVKGLIYVSATVKEGLGAGSALELLQWFALLLQYRAIDRIQIKAAQPAGSSTTQGWFQQSLKLEFWADQVSEQEIEMNVVQAIAAGNIFAARFVSYGGTLATTSRNVQGIAQVAATSGYPISLITGYSALVEAAESLVRGDFVKPHSDGSGRAVKGSQSDNCGRALQDVAANGLVQVRFVENASYGGTGGGASSVDDLEDASTPGKALMKAVDTAAQRTLLELQSAAQQPASAFAPAATATTATNAASAASAAASAAATAQTTANAAAGAATAAGEAAEEAQATAESALTAANDAVATAQSAETAATSATSAASAASSAAAAAQSTANSAVSGLSAKANTNNAALTGTPTAPTPLQADDSTRIATTAFVKAALALMLDSAPAALDTLNELAAALGDDPNFATTVTTLIAQKLAATDGTATRLTTAGTFTVGGGMAVASTTMEVNTLNPNRVYDVAASLTADAIWQWKNDILPAANRSWTVEQPVGNADRTVTFPTGRTVNSLATGAAITSVVLKANKKYILDWMTDSVGAIYLAGEQEISTTPADGSLANVKLANMAPGTVKARLDTTGAPTDIDIVTGLKPALALAVADVSGAAPLASPALSGNPTAPTQTAGDSTTKIATTAFVANALAALVASSPAALDTLNELAAALGNDANFATTVTNALALKAPLAGPAFSGNPTAPTQATSDNSTRIASTAFVKAVVAAGLVDTQLTGNPTAPTQALTEDSTRLATTAFAKAAAKEAPGTVTETTTARTLGTTDHGKIIRCTDVGGCAVTVPAAFSGLTCMIVAAAGVPVTVVQSGTTINGPLTIEGAATLLPTGAANTWDLVGSTGSFTEAVQDIVGALFVLSGGAYDDAAGTVTFPFPEPLPVPLRYSDAGGMKVRAPVSGDNLNIGVSNIVEAINLSGVIAALTLTLGVPANDQECTVVFYGLTGGVTALTWAGADFKPPAASGLVPTMIYGPTVIRLWWDASNAAWSILNIWRQYDSGALASPVASAATLDLWARAGLVIPVSGTTGPITSLGAGAPAGTMKIVQWVSTPTLVDNGTTVKVIGGGSRTMEAGSTSIFVAQGPTSGWTEVSFGAPSGRPRVGSVITDTWQNISAIASPVDGGRYNANNVGPCGVDYIYKSSVTRFVPIGVQCALQVFDVAGVQSASEQLIYNIAMPAKLLQGQHFRITLATTNNGTTDAEDAVAVRLNSSAVVGTSGIANGELISVTGLSAANGSGGRVAMEFRAISNTSIRKLGTAGAGPGSFAAQTSSSATTTYTVPDLSGVVYLCVVIDMAGATDTPTLSYLRLDLLGS